MMKMKNDEARTHDDIRVTKAFQYRLHHLSILASFVIRPSSFLAFVNDQLVSVWIAKLRHPAHRRFSLFNIEAHTVSFKFVDRGVDIFDLKSDRRAVA
jgi:hypothetical protein